MRDIKVNYDGSYPTTCMGTLTIIVDGNKVYENTYCCSSSGSIWFDSRWGEHVECGELTWDEDEASEFDEEIQEAVRDKLSEFSVCCGGCV